MSDTDPNLPVPAEPAPVLAKVDEQAAVGEIISEIAAEGYTPVKGRHWAGRSKIVEWTRAKYDVDAAEAARLVDAAVMDLFMPRPTDDKMAKVRLLEARLMAYRRVVLSFLNSGIRHREMVSEWIPLLDATGKPLVKPVPGQTGKFAVELGKAPKREHVNSGLDVVALRFLLELEALLADVNRLAEDSTSADKMTTILATLERTVQQSEENEITETKTLTVAQQTKLKQIKDLGPRGREVLERAMRASRKPEVVEGEVVEEGSDGEESV